MLNMSSLTHSSYFLSFSINQSLVFSLSVRSVSESFWWNLQQNVLEKCRDPVIGRCWSYQDSYKIWVQWHYFLFLNHINLQETHYEDIMTTEGKKGIVSSRVIVTNCVQVGEIVLHRLYDLWYASWVRESIPKPFVCSIQVMTKSFIQAWARFRSSRARLTITHCCVAVLQCSHAWLTKCGFHTFSGLSVNRSYFETPERF